MLGGAIVAAASLATGLWRPKGIGAQTPSEQFTVSGAGVNVKQMPAASGSGTVSMRESFSFDAHYAQCIVEDNADAFAMDTNAMGKVTIPPHSFFMGMYANDVSLVSIRRGNNNTRVARLTGSLGCATYAGLANTSVGSRTATEPAFFEIEATDGGHGGAAAGDAFSFTVYFDAMQAPINNAIFGPKFTFTGEMVAGEVTIDTPVTLPVVG
jgi:hypothetical protein